MNKTSNRGVIWLKLCQRVKIQFLINMQQPTITCFQNQSKKLIKVDELFRYQGLPVGKLLFLFLMAVTVLLNEILCLLQGSENQFFQTFGLRILLALTFLMIREYQIGFDPLLPSTYKYTDNRLRIPSKLSFNIQIIILIKLIFHLIAYKNIIMNPDDPDKKKPQDNFQYQYFKDTEGRLKRFRVKEYQQRPGYIRLKFLEKYYFWWKRKSFDFKNAIVPWFMGFTAVFIIYKSSMIWSQNDLNRQIKAKLPFEYSSEVMGELKKLRKQSD